VSWGDIHGGGTAVSKRREAAHTSWGGVYHPLSNVALGKSRTLDASALFTQRSFGFASGHVNCTCFRRLL
jgi:hypothetical protein